MSSTESLFKGLQVYNEQLNMHIAQLQQEYSELEMHWNCLNPVFHGDAADQFRVCWRQTVADFNEYLERANRVSEVLEERIKHLDEYLRRSDIL